uniref:Uncharacterized protein n=1 Tax=Arundo donax TaxID=35708 RepID=A0A0A9B1S0_ARUDO
METPTYYTGQKTNSHCRILLHEE